MRNEFLESLSSRLLLIPVVPKPVRDSDIDREVTRGATTCIPLQELELVLHLEVSNQNHVENTHTCARKSDVETDVPIALNFLSVEFANELGEHLRLNLKTIIFFFVFQVFYKVELAIFLALANKAKVRLKSIVHKIISALFYFFMQSGTTTMLFIEAVSWT